MDKGGEEATMAFLKLNHQPAAVILEDLGKKACRKGGPRASSGIRERIHTANRYG